MRNGKDKRLLENGRLSRKGPGDTREQMGNMKLEAHEGRREGRPPGGGVFRSHLREISPNTSIKQHNLHVGPHFPQYRIPPPGRVFPGNSSQIRQQWAFFAGELHKEKLERWEGAEEIILVAPAEVWSFYLASKQHCSR